MKIVYTGEQDTRAFKSMIPEIIDEIAKEDEKVC